MDIYGIEEKDVYNFLQSCWPKVQLHGDAIEKIYNKTRGNAFALRVIARKLSLGDKLETILDGITNPADNIAHQWVGATFNGLQSEEQSLLKAHSIFKGSVDYRILAKITGFDLDDEEQLLNFNKHFKNLCDLRAFSLDETTNRSYLEEPYASYVYHSIKEDTNEKKEWNEKRVDCYKRLRGRVDAPFDKPGWTIFTDYIPDNPNQVDYAKEVENIIDVISYCMSPKRDDKHWLIAADLLDDFRATLFATGKWDERITLCDLVLQRAIQENQNHIVGRLKRLTAWIHCFQDDIEAEKLAQEALQIACNGIQNKEPLLIKERTIHRQTYYKALNTLGQIALRKGQDESNKGQIARRAAEKEAKKKDLNEQKLKVLKEIEMTHFKRSQKFFVKAGDWFTRSSSVVQAEFPPEMLITDFHIAEVGFYNRHFQELALEHVDEYVCESLEKSLQIFKDILTSAEIEVQPHKRLIAHIQYYLGKIYRRLVRYVEADKREEFFSNAMEAFEKALDIAGTSDIVLKSRVNFAKAQWYYERSERVTMESEKNSDIEKSKSILLEAAENLSKLGMEMECADATSFYIQHFGSADIDQKLLDAFKKRYGSVIPD